MAKIRPAIRLICWKEDRAVELAAELEAAGFVVDSTALEGPGIRALGQSPPDAVVIDLGRLPAQGRDVGVTLRTTARSRQTPLVFVDGAEDKVARTREVLPDAGYSSREEMVESIERAPETVDSGSVGPRRHPGSSPMSPRIWSDLPDSPVDSLTSRSVRSTARGLVCVSLEERSEKSVVILSE